MNVSIFEGVPREHRAFGIAVATLLMHAVGRRAVTGRRGAAQGPVGP